MPQQPPIGLFAFAQRSQEQQPLPALQQEREQIEEALKHKHDNDQLQFEARWSTSVDKLFQLSDRFFDRLSIFHFAGHSDMDHIVLQDHVLRARHLSITLGMNDGLQLVFLNSCRSAGMVELLLERGAKVVIATHPYVKDKLALRMARYFYEALAAGKTIKDAFDSAQARLEAPEGEEVHFFRGIAIDLEEKHSNAWGLFYNDEADLNWALPQVEAYDADKDFTSPVPLSGAGYNELVIKGLVEGLIKYGERQEIQQLAELWKGHLDEEAPTVINDLLPVLSKLLPSPVSVYLNDLIQETTEGRERLQTLCDLYEVSSRLLLNLALADFWQHFWKAGHTVQKLPKAYHETLVATFKHNGRPGNDSIPPNDHLKQLMEVCLLMEKSALSPFIPPVYSFGNKLLHDKALFTSYVYLEKKLKQPLNQKIISRNQVEEICLEAEWHLGKLLHAAGFFGQYHLLSVTDISVQKKMKTMAVEYHHQFARVNGQQPVYRSGQLPGTEFPCNHTVLWKKRDEQDYANAIFLSPFVIDKNAYIKTPEKQSDLHFLEHYSDNEGTYLRAIELDNKLSIPANIKEDSLENRKNFQRFNRKELHSLLLLCQEFFDDLKPHFTL
jgi:hypothetical protein